MARRTDTLTDTLFDTRSMLPERIGPYRIESILGAGGMGIVYRADAPSGEKVAIKTLRPQVSTNQQVRFEREGQIRIDHPNVIRVLDSGTDEHGTPYIALELLLGQSLEERLQRGTLSVLQLVPMVRQACLGLAAVHAVGVVHRDLKPANLFCCADGTVKVLDFGIAQVGSGPKLTAEGTVLGSVSYLSPEQARGRPDVDASTDVWAMGALMFEALVGEAPFDRGSPLATLLAIIQEHAPPVSGRTSLPPALAEIIDRCLSKQADRRYRDAQELIAALDAMPAVAATLTAHAAGAAPIMVARPSLPPGEERVVVVVLVRGVADRAPVERTISELGGDPIPFLDEGVIGLFGARSWEGDEITRAVEAALRCRPGAGSVAVGSGRARSIGTSVSGAAVKAAMRGCAAGLGGVAVDPETARALEAGFRIEQAAEDLFEVTGLRRHSSVAAPAQDSLPILGRESEVARMRLALESMLELRSAQVIEVTGPLGIGKSRLRYELERLVAASGERIRLLSARGEPLHKDSALHLWATLLWRQVRMGSGSADLALAPERRQELLYTRVREALGDHHAVSLHATFLAELLGFPVEEIPELREARADAQLMADRLRLTVLDHISGLADQGPVALLIEDLQWVDRASLELLERMVGELAERPVIVFLSSRRPVLDTDLGQWSAVALERIALGGLTRPLAGQLARAVVGRALPDAIVDKLARRTEGNPFFIEQLGLALRERPDLDALELDELPLPSTVEGALQSRLDHLPEDAREALKRASVLGRPFLPEELSALGAGELSASIELLLQRELLVPAPGSAAASEELSFLSPLMAEVTYRSLAPELRCDLHRRAAEYLAGARGVGPEEPAIHYEKAGAPALAAASYARAALAAARRADSDSVLRCSERALALGAPASAMHELHMARAGALSFLGRRADQGQELDQALRHADSDLSRARALTEKISWLMRTGQIEEAFRVGEQAVAAARASGDAEALVTALCRQADARVLAGDHAQAQGLIGEAASVARVQAPRLRTFVDDRRALLAHTRGDLGQSLLAYARVVKDYTAMGSVRCAAAIQQNLADCYNRLGAYAQAEAALRSALADCHRVGNRTHAAYALANLAYAQHHQGQPDAALVTLQQAAALAEAMDDARLALYIKLYRARALVATGSTEEGLAEARGASAQAERQGQASLQALGLAAAARALLLLGRGDEALDASARALALRDEIGSLEEDEGEVFLAHADSLRASGRLAESEAVCRRAAERLSAVAGRIRDPAWRERFKKDVPAHRRLFDIHGA